MTDNRFISLDEGRLLVSEQFMDALRAQGLVTFARFMEWPAQRAVRAVPGRSTVRIEYVDGDTVLAGYLKRYERGYLSFPRRLLRWLHWPNADDEAAREWRKLLLLRKHGFRTAEPIALGQRRMGGAVCESFLLQREIPGGVPSDEFFLKHLAEAAPRERWELLRQIGELAGRFLGAGFIHKDLYFKHVFVARHGSETELFLIDLQRVLGPRRHRERWLLKDLGALGYSALTHAKRSRTDLLRLYRGYSGKPRLDKNDKRLLRRIWRRIESFLSRQPKYRRVWNAPPG